MTYQSTYPRTAGPARLSFLRALAGVGLAILITAVAVIGSGFATRPAAAVPAPKGSRSPHEDALARLIAARDDARAAQARAHAALTAADAAYRAATWADAVATWTARRETSSARWMRREVGRPENRLLADLTGPQPCPVSEVALSPDCAVVLDPYAATSRAVVSQAEASIATGRLSQARTKLAAARWYFAAAVRQARNAEEAVKATYAGCPRTAPASHLRGVAPAEVYELCARSAAAARTPQAAAAIKFAMSQIGQPYCNGAKPEQKLTCGEDTNRFGRGPARGYDCSGFVWRAYQEAGVDLGSRHTVVTTQQVGMPKGIPISRAEARPGDLVSPGSRSCGHCMHHISMVLADGWKVHASGTNVGVIVSRIPPNETVTIRIDPTKGT